MNSTSRPLRHILSAAAVVASVGLTALIPVMVGMSWSAIITVLAGISVVTLVGLGVLWAAGLLVHTIVLRAALPGLTTRRALLLNISGSAVSNVAPFGGAAGVGLGYVMARSWKVSPASFASFTAISNLWNVVGKLLVGTVLISAALILGVNLPPAFHGVLAYGTAVVLAVTIALIVALSSRTVADRLGRSLDIGINAVLRRLGSPRRVEARTWVHETRAANSATVSTSWARLTLGVLAYLFLQALLMAGCLIAVGAHVPWTFIAVAFAVERLITVIPFTPGGSGLAELGSVAVLVALGVDPVGAASGILLYRLFTFLLEIPLGGISALVWFRHHRATTHELVAA
ncbi:hypothetical protein C6I20_05225 [Aeromicrobium sp. A1-2]|uniref:lysylphosphatidylglycerol synthase domain-containing protein n=1 Tax=Aeromicrobium sp. A1-2 TaxID=2107713 RepID=UPI000E4CB04E|nr:lysylphosphatidylglycerol synthase domain-containing protein [Aeromicrobium sp. A1-2]AXT84653.1 hypothetical protein C6I20_05225 [Aeromicrobium sp. A1-2]